MGEDFSAFHAGACLSNLPLGSALMGALEPACRWTQTEYLLHGLLCFMAGKEIPLPWEKEKHGIEGVATESVTLDEFREWYENTQWREVEEWHKEIL